ncbi:MAG: hypothetical protein JRJ58_20390 [Deltaproteobacteria bacterium]|nr:hypothetical protein [Deltaproteobacteria bacterium]
MRSGLGQIVSKLMLEPIGFKGIRVAPPLNFGFVYEDTRILRVRRTSPEMGLRGHRRHTR